MVRLPTRCAECWVIALVLFLAGSGLARPASATQFDCQLSHTFSGFGLNIWALASRAEPLLDLADELRVKFVRWKMLPDTTSADVPDDPSFATLVEWLERLVSAQGTDGERGFALFRLLGSSGIGQIPAPWAVPGKWQVGGPRPPQDGKERLIQDTRVDDFGRLLAAMITVLERHDVRPYAVELLNEPPNKLFANHYAGVLRSFRSSERANGLHSTSVGGAGAVFTWGNRPYLQEVAKQNEKLDIISTHAYDALKTHQLASVTPLADAIPSEWKGRPIFVTEYGIDPQLWYPQQSDAADTVPYAVRAAAQTLTLLGTGANVTFYWQAQDPPWATPPYWGLLSKEDKRRPAIDALRTIVRPLEVGDAIASSERRDPPLPVMLAARPGKLVLEIANPDPEPQEYQVTLRNCSAAPIAIAKTTAWPPDHTVQVQAPSAASLHITMPGQTVASIETTR